MSKAKFVWKCSVEKLLRLACLFWFAYNIKVRLVVFLLFELVVVSVVVVVLEQVTVLKLYDE